MKLNSPISACEPERLESFLSGTLSDAQERDFTLHLSGCENCCSALEQQAAEPEAWREAEELLKPSQFEATLPDEEGDATRSPWGKRTPLQIQNVVDTLGPTDDPAMLGRLGGYEVSGVVGAGGMGVVLKALDPSLDRTVAIKVLAPYLASSGAARKRFAREAKAAAAVLHPNVIAIHSVSNNETALPYLVMPYVRGTSLQKRLDSEGPLPLQEILRIGAQIAAGLAAAHAQGLVHRDIKPANILLEDGVERVTITDFGLARAVDDATITHSGMIAGTPQFMSPEQARGEAVDARSDLFSLGSVLYAICTGRPPFRAETSYGVMRRITDDNPTAIREINPDAPQWLCQLIGKLMSKQAAARYQSAAEVAELLEACLAHVQQPTVAKLPPALRPVKSDSRFSFNSRVRLGVIAMIATLGLSLLGLFAWQATEAPDIAGNWSGEEWGQVDLKKTADGEYSGTYSDTFKENPGTIEVKWSRLERRYKGIWREGQERSGKISLRLVDEEIRGAWTTSRKSEINPGTPELADLTWKRSHAPQADEVSGIRVRVLLSTDTHSREVLRKNIGFDQLSIMVRGIKGTVNGESHDNIEAAMAHGCRLERFDETKRGGKRYWGATLFVPQDSKSDGSNLELSQQRIDGMLKEGVQFWLDHLRDAREPAAQASQGDADHSQGKQEKGGKAGGRRPQLQGTVTEVKDQELVEISLGEDDGLRAGEVLHVFRAQTYLARVVVQRLVANKSVARIDTRSGEIQRGDRVLTAAAPTLIPATELQLKIAAPENMEVAVADDRGDFSQPSHRVPARLNLAAGKIYRLKLSNLAGHEGTELYPSVELAPTTPRTDAFLAHNAIPIEFTGEDFDQASVGNFVTKVVYLPDPEFQDLSQAGVETLISTRLEPGRDPITDADRRGSILAVVRLGNKDVGRPGAPPQNLVDARPGTPGRVKISDRKQDESRLWNAFGVTREPVAPLTAKVLEWSGLHLNPITKGEFRDKNVLAKYSGGLDVNFVRSHGPAEKAGVNEVDIVVGLQGRALTTLKELDAAVQDAVEQVKRGDADALQWDVLREGETIRVNMPFPVRELALESPAASGATNSDSNAVLPKRLHFFTTDEKVKLVACSPDGKLIAVATDQSTLPSPQIDWKRAALIMDAGSGKVVKLQITTPAEYSQLAANRGTPRSEVTALAWAPDGSLLAIGTSLGQVKLFNPHTGEVMSALDDAKARPEDNQVLRKLTAVKRAMGSVASLAFSPDGSLLATCGGSFEDVPFDRTERGRLGEVGPGRVKVWEVRTGTLKHDLAGHSDAAAVAFSADGKLLASAGSWSGPEHGNGVIVWNPETGEKLRTIEQKANGGVRSIVFGPDKNLLAFAALEFDKDSDTKSTKIVVAHGGSGITEWQQSIPRGATVEGFSPAGKSIAVLTHGRSVEFFDTETGQANHEINLASSPETLRWADLSVAARGNTLAIGGVGKDRQGTVEIWIVPSGAGKPASVEEGPNTADESAKEEAVRFSETKELFLSMDSLKFMLDLDTGATMDSPQTIRPEQEKMDIRTDQVQPYHYPKALIGLGLQGMEVKESDWHVSAAEVRRALAGKGVEPLKEMDQGPEKHPTYFFKTRDGACGVLQLLEIVEKPKGIRVRYKTIEAKPSGEQRGEILTPKQVVERGQKLSHSRQRIVVRMKVAENKPVTLVDEKGSQHQHWNLFDADTAEFSIRITNDGQKALLQRDMLKIPNLFVGEWIEVEGSVQAVGLDLISRPDTTWTYHIELNSLDQVSFPPADEAPELAGTWRFQSAESEEEGWNQPGDVVRKWLWWIRGSELSGPGPVPGYTEATFKLNAKADPKEIDLTYPDGGGRTLQGIYKLEEGRLIVCLRSAAEAKRGHPKDFKFAGGEGLSLLVLTKVESKSSPQARAESRNEDIDRGDRAAGESEPTLEGTVEFSPPMSEQEKAVAKLVLVFFDDKSRRAVPSLVLNAGGATFVITAGPATVVPDGTAHAVDRTLIELAGKEQPIPVEYDSRSTTEFHVYQIKDQLDAIQLKETATVTEGDTLTTLSTSRTVPKRATVVGSGRRAKFELPDHKIERTYEDLIEVDQALPEGTPLFKNGKLVGLTLLGTRYAGNDAKKSYVVPAARIVELCERLASPL